MKLIVAFLTFLLFTARSFSQDSTKVYYCDLDPILNIPIIPETILDSEYDVIVLDYEKDFAAFPFINAGYEISWPSISIDGSFVIVVNPQQIYLKSGHENPNPNYVYWVKNINADLYTKIVLSIKSNRSFRKTGAICGNNCIDLFYRKYHSEKYIPGELTDSLMAEIVKDHDQKLYDNFKDIISIFNKQLNMIERITIPDFDSFSGQKIKRLVMGLYELEDQIQFDKLK